MEVITEAEQKTIIEWANKNYTTFTKNGEYRQYKILTGVIPIAITMIKERLINKENLRQVRQEPELKDYISYIQPGGQVEPHTNQAKDGLCHTRFEVYVQLPEQGGLPIIDNKVTPVNEREYIRSDSTTYTVSSQVIKGTKARILLSFGFLMPPL